MSKKIYYKINKDGAIAGSFEEAPPENNLTITHATPPPEDMLKPRWVGGADTGQWVDVATRAEHGDRIDQETDGAIKNWARGKGKNEEYYINCGIRSCAEKISDTTNIDYRHYREYRAFVDAQKKLGKAKKDALM